MNDQAKAQLSKLAPIFDVLGEKPVGLSVLGSGVQASVWQIRTERSRYALRVLKPKMPGLDSPVDARLRTVLCDLGAAVVRPVLTSADVKTPEIAAQWVLDEFVDGRPIGEHPARLEARALGLTLSLLHNLDPESWSEIPTMYPEALDILVRSGALAQLAGGSARHKEVVQSTLDQSKHTLVICHGDLHKNQMLRLRSGGLALLDFGLARRCDARWDLGAALFAFGAECYASLIDGYEKPRASYRNVLPFAQTLAIAALARGRPKASANARRFLDQNPV